MPVCKYWFLHGPNWYARPVYWALNKFPRLNKMVWHHAASHFDLSDACIADLLAALKYGNALGKGQAEEAAFRVPD